MTSSEDKPGKSIDDLLGIMAALRTPITGCPWDLEQSFETIAPYTIEEAYEVADAIERGDLDDLKDELGDLLLQVVYHAQLAQEQKSFDFADVVDAICRKMIRRHPHVFGDESVRSSVEMKGLWERIKAQERAEKEKSRGGGESSVPAHGIFDDMPVALPALARAVKLQDRAARTGFDWPDIRPVFEKLTEELGELESELVEDKPDQKRIAEEFGDVMFVVANLARHLNLDADASLRSANTKFIRRFSRMASLLEAGGGHFQSASLEEMERYWVMAKQEEKKSSG